MVDAAYNNATGYLAPYRNVRYHMQHWRGARRPSTPQELFNFKHSQVRVIIEHAFGRLKNKFQILFRVPNYRVHIQRRIVVACMALHNFIIDNGGDTGGSSMYCHLSLCKTYQHHLHRMCHPAVILKIWPYTEMYWHLLCLMAGE